MNALHPIIQQALAPFAPQPYRPTCPAGMVAFSWVVNPDLTVACQLDYEAAERGSRESGTGLQMEPDYPATLTLVSAWVRDKDVYELLSDEQKAEIEALALQNNSESMI